MHSAVVYLWVKAGGTGRNTTVQNWSKDVFNLNTKRAIGEAHGTVEWVGGSMGAKKVMLYPGSFLIGEGARADHLRALVLREGLVLAGIGTVLGVTSKRSVENRRVETSAPAMPPAMSAAARQSQRFGTTLNWNSPKA